MSPLRAVVLALLALLAAACTGNGQPTAAPTVIRPGAAITSPGPGAVSPAPDPAPPASPGRAPASPAPAETAAGPAACPPVSGGGQTSVKLADIRVGTHTGYDRVVFEFAPPVPPAPAATLPGFTVTKQDAITQDGSGNPVSVEGTALYALVMQGASGVDLRGEQVVQTYAGPREFRPRFPVLVELEHAGDFEDVLSWGIGLRAERCIKATQLNNPLRLVLDIPHG